MMILKEKYALALQMRSMPSFQATRLKIGSGNC